MKYISVFSGIEAATVAWKPLSWEALAFAETDPFPCAVLKHHFPDVRNMGDIKLFKEWPHYANVDVLVGGSPCQSFSVAGLRKGLDDPRGNLALTYLAIVGRYRPRWVVWENVPGVLSSSSGRDFACFLTGLAKLGYGFAYRILDAQYFGIPQRRRRVFAVGHIGGLWQRAAAVLFERHSLSRNPPPRQGAREDVAGTLISGAKSGGFSNSVDFAAAGYMTPVAGTIDAASGASRGAGTSPSLLVPAYGIPGNWIGRAPENGGNATEPMRNLSPCLTKSDRHGVCYGGGNRESINVATTLNAHGCRIDFDSETLVAFHGSQDPDVSGSVTHPLGRNRGQETCVMQNLSVRRLTPTECERLMGFPDGYTLVPYRGKPAADGPRYKALGNSMVVPVMRWIGERIAAVDQMVGEPVAAAIVRANYAEAVEQMAEAV